MRRRSQLGILALFALLLLAAVPVMAAEEGANVRPDPLPEWFFKDEVDAEFVKQHVVVPRTDSVMIIDARPYMTKYAQGYIPTAYNVSPSEMEQELPKMLPENKEALLIFYCGGYACKLSHKAANLAVGLGYKNVKVYAAGFPDWKNKGYDVGVESEYVKELVAGGKTPYLLIDARPHNKFLEGHIPSSVNISDTQFDEMKGMLPQDKSVQLIYYCGGYACKLSHKSADKAKKLGYTNVVINESGYPGWKEKFGGSGAVEISAGGAEGAMDVAQFEKMLKESPDAIRIIDVRDPDEFKKGHFPGAENVPVDKMAEMVDAYQSDKPTVFVCSTGARSGECYYMFLDKRPDKKDVYYLEATIEYNEDGTYTIKPNK